MRDGILFSRLCERWESPVVEPLIPSQSHVMIISNTTDVHKFYGYSKIYVFNIL